MLLFNNIPHHTKIIHSETIFCYRLVTVVHLIPFYPFTSNPSIHPSSKIRLYYISSTLVGLTITALAMLCPLTSSCPWCHSILRLFIIIMSRKMKMYHHVKIKENAVNSYKMCFLF